MNTSLNEPLIGSIVFIFTFAISAAGVALFRRLSISRNWLDRPNQRSAHNEPTPTGAGVVIVLVSLSGYLAAVVLLDSRLSWGYLIGALLVATISWLDDLYSLAYLTRLAAHCLAAILVVLDAGYLSIFGVSTTYSIDLGTVGAIVTVVWILWSINAYNFMDGIDGLAGVQGVAAAGTWAWLSLAVPSLFIFNISIVGACFGFLVHNWPPAKVFMGDVGSAFLGFTFGSMTVLYARENSAAIALLPIIAVLSVWPFNFDAGLTRLRRALRFERFWEPHREHLYQRLTLAGFGPEFVIIIYGLLALAAGLAAVAFITTDGWLALSPIGVLFVISLVLAGLTNRLENRPRS